MFSFHAKLRGCNRRKQKYRTMIYNPSYPSTPSNHQAPRFQVHHNATRHVLSSAGLRKEPGHWSPSRRVGNWYGFDGSEYPAPVDDIWILHTFPKVSGLHLWFCRSSYSNNLASTVVYCRHLNCP